MTTKHSALEVARGYLGRGWSPIPVPAESKAPIIDGWPSLRIAEGDLPKYFNGAKLNIGVLLGSPSNGLVDVDLDCPEAVQLASAFLPPDGATFGRPSKPASHHLFRCEVTTLPATQHFVESLSDRKTMVVELRSTGAQTIFPGSTYAGEGPDRKHRGESIRWDRDVDPVEVNGERLSVAVRQLAAASLLLRYWGKGNRDWIATAMTGLLLDRHHWSKEQTDEFIGFIAREANDEEWRDRPKAESLRGRRPGLPKLRELIGPDAANRIDEWLRVGRKPTAADLPEGALLIEAGQMHKAVAHLDRAFGNAHHVFAREAQLVIPVMTDMGDHLKHGIRREVGSLILTAPSVSKIRTLASEHVPCFHATANGPRPIDLPQHIAAALIEAKSWTDIRQIVGIATAPVFRGDGSIISDNGYDEATRLFVHMPPGLCAAIPSGDATRDDALQALDTLRAPFREFPLVPELGADGCLLAMLLTPPSRHLYDGAPAFGLSAPTRGTGKTL